MLASNNAWKIYELRRQLEKCGNRLNEFRGNKIEPFYIEFITYGVK